jgi:transcriptional regulator with XRE-family HTH domain
MNMRHPAINQNDVRGHDLQTVLGKRLRQARKSQKLTMAELGRRAQCSQSFLSKVENGSMIPSLPMLQRLARALGVKSSALVSEVVQSVGDHTAGRVTDSEQDP